MAENNTQAGWRTTHQVVILIIKSGHGTRKYLLMGPKTEEPLTGLVVPPGGHHKFIDGSWEDHVTCGIREGDEETDLTLRGGKIVGQLRVIVTEKCTERFVTYVLFDDWNGKLRNKTKEFKYLKFFPFLRLPWKRMPPGEEQWMKRMLFEDVCEGLLVVCGRNCKDFRYATSYPFKPNGVK